MAGGSSITERKNDVRDLSTFADKRLVWNILKVSLLYLTLGTVYFAWFFSVYACGGPHTPCDWELTSAPVTTPADNNTTGLDSVVEAYPNNDGAGFLAPLLDAIMFMLSTAMTVGWGNQPVDLTTRHETGDVRNHSQLFASTKLFLCCLAFVGVVAIGLILGTLGASFRAMCRKQVHDRVAAAITKHERKMLKTKHGKLLGLSDSAHHHGSVLENHDLLIAVLLLVICILIGTVAYTWTETECMLSTMDMDVCRKNAEGDPEGWRYLEYVDAMYLTVISVSTVGFGDYAPSTTASKLFTIVYLPIAVGFTANAIDHVSSHLISHRVRKLETYVLGQYGGAEDRGRGTREKSITAYDFEELRRSVELDHSNPAMSRNDFRLAVSDPRSRVCLVLFLNLLNCFVASQMLMRLARVHPGDFKMIDEAFTLLDANGSGEIEPPWTEPDLKGWLQKKKKLAQSEISHGA
jgi:uncharacterized membrane protein